MACVLKDEEALRWIRSLPCCLCGNVAGVQAHHVIRRGMGGGSRFDHPNNLLSVCGLGCHDKVDRLPKSLQFALVAIRTHLKYGSGPTAAEVEDTVRAAIHHRH